MKFKLYLVLISVFVVLTNGSLFSKKVGTLEKILKPKMMKVFDNELFVVEGNKIFIYSLEDLKLKNVIGKKGDGPGEYKKDPSRPIMVSVTKKQIIAESRYKVVFFSRSGQFIREIKKTNFSTLQVLPIGNNYLVYKYVFVNPAKNQAYFKLCIHNNKMKEIKELHSQEFFAFEDKIFVMPDSINYRIYKNKIYVDKSNIGFIIDIYDFSGKKLSSIKKDFKKINITKSEKEIAYKEYVEIPSLRRLKRTQGEAAIKNYLKTVKFIYPEYHNPIKDIAVNNDIIYIRTSKIKDNKEEYELLDLKGKLIGTKYLSQPKKQDYIVRIQGDKKYYNISNGKYYYLKLVSLEDDEEEWVLYEEKI